MPLREKTKSREHYPPGPDTGEFLVPEVGYQAAQTAFREQERVIYHLRETLARNTHILHQQCHTDNKAGDRGWQHCNYSTCREATKRVFG